jgi:hypothetical protein
MDLREEVHELLGSIERYNPNNLDVFIEYAKATVRKETRFPLFLLLMVSCLILLSDMAYDACV